MNWVDALLLLIIIITSVRGAIRGFIETLFSFVTVVSSIILTKIFYVPFSNFIMKNVGLATKIQNIFTTLLEEVGFSDLLLGDAMTLESLPGPLRVLLHGTRIFESGVNTSTMITNMFISVVVGAILFLTFYIMFKVVAYLFEGIFTLPVLKHINVLAGLGLGALKSFIYIGLVLLFICFVGSVMPDSAFADSIHNSVIVGFLKHIFIFKTILDF